MSSLGTRDAAASIFLLAICTVLQSNCLSCEYLAQMGPNVQHRGPKYNHRRDMQVHALVAAPFLLDQPGISDMFPTDAISRAKRMLEVCAQPMRCFCKWLGIA